MPKYMYDLFVIGGGSGGVRGSRMASSYGAKVIPGTEALQRRYLRPIPLRKPSFGDSNHKTLACSAFSPKSPGSPLLARARCFLLGAVSTAVRGGFRLNRADLAPI